ncbi:MAG TPA: DUF485 domain-containing protein [Longimicrobium sp.]|nr:DUF485 domain-containing protein [Longimicrobium sp.]
MPRPTPPPPPPPAAAPQAAWSVVEAEPQFRELVAARRRFIVPATVFFIVYYFALPILVGYFPGVMDRDVIGNINLAYLFALSQFVMAWVVMWLYVRRARHFDALEHAVVQRHAGRSM